MRPRMPLQPAQGEPLPARRRAEGPGTRGEALRPGEARDPADHGRRCRSGVGGDAHGTGRPKPALCPTRVLRIWGPERRAAAWICIE